MLGALKQEQWLRTVAVDARGHGHANGGIASNDTPHHAHTFLKVDEHHVVRPGWRPWMNDGHRVDRAPPARPNPVPLSVPGSRLRHTWWKETASTSARSLQAQLAACQCFSPLLLRPHGGKLWAVE